MQYRFLARVLMATILFVTGCDRPSQSLVLEGKTMGTFWRVSLADVDESRKQLLCGKIQAQLDTDDRLLSTWKPDSALMHFNTFSSTVPWRVDAGIADIISLALRIGKKTDGAMDITLGPLVNLWGFGPDKQPLVFPDANHIAAARKRTGLQHLSIKMTVDGQWLQKDIPDLFIDLSTLGEGYAADRLARLMEEEGISRYLVSVGGALVSRGLNPGGIPWRVAIQKPTDRENAVQERVDINGHGISTAGSYRNYYELDGKRLSHVIDPATGSPIKHSLVSVTVIAPTALEADAWDTGLMVLGTERAKALALKEKLAVYLIMKQKDGFSVWMSPQFKSFLLSPEA